MQQIFTDALHFVVLSKKKTPRLQCSIGALGRAWKHLGQGRGAVAIAIAWRKCWSVFITGTQIFHLK
ncbi:hypothetical protein C798_07680 [Herbaspirillum rubrisubalbicans Os34]|uniref:Uncharacterized protein n=1 Tax=Herbaspirillum rubrisubalbicans Os34 TaxID=1235827 RepID=A0A6M3ZNF5_9BURK|nr:hypothetical protein C798_07680 [Herbaspirillum rubrisubalbicans Os34]